ncbi:MAG TPA: sulfite exporter TauE/SafE family protein [Gemmataceae bacterium]|jgi:sulfite exporter TauE/SafE|nr:sulfite exporter TauE/SafE family protein [Gemmataceae bacterium]
MFDADQARNDSWALCEIMEFLFHLLASCRYGVAYASEARMALPASLLLAGLAGSATHCIGMCGPFVLSQVMADAKVISPGRYGEWRRLTGAALLPYHLGRFTSYTVIGGIAGGITAVFISTASFGWLTALLLLVASVLMLAQALGFAIGTSSPLTARLARLAGPLANSKTAAARYMLGVVLGFLPCGLLYGAIAVAAGSGSPITGALGMAAFSIGTMPALAVVGWLGLIARRRLHVVAAWVAGPLLIANAAVTAALALQRI